MASTSSASLIPVYSGGLADKHHAGVNLKAVRGTITVAGLADDETIGLVQLPANAIILELGLWDSTTVNVDVNIGIRRANRTAIGTPGDEINEGGTTGEAYIAGGPVTINAEAVGARHEYVGAPAGVTRGMALWEIHDRIRVDGGVTALGHPDPDNGAYEIVIQVQDAAVVDPNGVLEFELLYFEP